MLIIFAMLSLRLCFGFSAFKIMQADTATNYVHSKECQKVHYLELDCFDSCYGTQIHAHSQHKHNVPVETNIVSAYDALIVQPLKIVRFNHQVIQMPVVRINNYRSSFPKGIFRPSAVSWFIIYHFLVFFIAPVSEQAYCMCACFFYCNKILLRRDYNLFSFTKYVIAKQTAIILCFTLSAWSQ